MHYRTISLSLSKRRSWLPKRADLTPHGLRYLKYEEILLGRRSIRDFDDDSGFIVRKNAIWRM